MVELVTQLLKLLADFASNSSTTEGPDPGEEQKRSKSGDLAGGSLGGREPYPAAVGREYRGYIRNTISIYHFK
jgi:hypothetical protein